MFPCQRGARRGGSLYVVVMGVGMLVSVIALASSSIGRLEARNAIRNEDASRARLCARSGVEYALNWLNREPTWRTSLTSGATAQTVWINGGAFEWTVTDTDGDLADDPRDHAVLRVEGGYKESFAVIEVDIEPAGRALTCLQAVVAAGNNVYVDSGGDIEGSGFVYAGNDAEAKGTDIDLDVEAVGQVIGGSWKAEETEGVPPREMPGDHVFDWYLERGTEIPLASIPESFGKRRFELRMVSRWYNDFGDIDPNGIYWIDLEGEAIDLKWSRVLGTLVLLNAGAGTTFSDVAIHQGEPLNYPCLMVQGNLTIDLRSFITSTQLREQWIFNYNPPGMPYNGDEDNDKTDNRDATLDGIVYVTGTVTFTDEATVRGCVVAEDVVVNDGETLTTEYRPYAFYYPPPGFSAGTGVRVLPGTWRRTSQ